MWYEILPCVGIMVVAMALPHFSAYTINKLAIGNCYRRCLDDKEMRMRYLRDRRLTNNPYKVNGLDAIPDNLESL